MASAGKALGVLGGLAFLILIVVGLYTLLSEEVKEQPLEEPMEVAKITEPPQESPNDPLKNAETAHERELITPEETETPAPKATTDKDERLPLIMKGRFLDADGLPVNNVEVIKEYGNRTVLGASLGDGRFRIPVKEAPIRNDHYSFHIRTKKQGYVSYHQKIHAPPGEFLMGDIELGPGGAVYGHVSDENGIPVAEASMELSNADISERQERYLKSHGAFHEIDTFSGQADGSYLREGIPVGYIRVWARGEGTEFVWSDPIEIREGVTTGPVDLVLPPSSDTDCISGIVLDPEGKPVPRAKVRLSFKKDSRSGRSSRSAEEDGTFRFDSEPGFTYNIEANDRQSKYSKTVVKGIAPGTTNIVVQLPPLLTLSLSVLDENADPLDDFEVSVKQENSRRYVRPLLFTAKDRDEKGRVQVPIPDAAFEVEVESEGYFDAKDGPYDPYSLPEYLEIRLDPTPGVRGVVLAEGSPLADVQMSLHEDKSGGEYVVNDIPARSSPSPEVDADSDANGVFCLFLKDSGIYYLRAEKEGFAPTELGPFEINPNLGKEGLQVAMRQGGAIEGRILVPSGQDPSGMVVCISRGDAFPKTMRSDENGLFRFENLTPGRWHVEHREEDIDPHSSSATWSSGDNLEKSELPWSCMVEEGKTTYWDLDLLEGKGCALQGLFLLGGKAPGPWSATLTERSSLDFLKDRSRTGLGPDGRFLHKVNKEGDYILSVSGEPSIGPRITLRDRVSLQKGENDWQYDLVTGRLEIWNLSSLEEEGKKLFYTWEGEGSLEAQIELPKGKEGEPVILTVPAGRGELITAYYLSRRTGSGDDMVTLLPVEVDAGSKVKLEL